MTTQQLTMNQLAQKEWTEKRLQSYGYADLQRIERKLADHGVEVPGELSQENIAKAISLWDSDDAADDDEILAELGRMALDHLDRVAEATS